MRKLASAVLAIPIVLLLVVPALLRRSAVARPVPAIVAVALLAVGALGALPGESQALPPSEPAPIAAAAFTSRLAVSHGPADPVTIEFSRPMDAASVAAALKVEPATPVELAWSEDGRVLEVDAAGIWTPGTLHTITVGRSAHDRDGRLLEQPARAVFLVRPETIAAFGVVSAGGPISLDSTFALEFDRPVDLSTVQAAFQVDPAVEGTLAIANRRGPTTRVVFTPAAPLSAGTTYVVRLVGTVTDLDGAVVAPPPALELTTITAPEVVRFRPAHGATVPRNQTFSVRFTAPMDRAATEAAYRVLANGKPVAGKLTWAEGDTVLALDPSSNLPYGAKITVQVTGAATSAEGAPLGKARRQALAVTPKPTPRPAGGGGSGGSGGGGGGGGGGGSGGSSAGGGSWAAVETYYLKLMNCTRTGGWVTSSGGCSSPGGRNVAALKLDSGISTKVARPYAKKLATGNICSHFSGGDPGDRLRRAGYTSYRWAENLGCRSGNPYSAVLGSHLYFQSEKSYNGGHYRHIMDAAYDRVGIGVWVSSGRVRLVVDFYHP